MLLFNLKMNDNRSDSKGAGKGTLVNKYVFQLFERRHPQLDC